MIHQQLSVSPLFKKRLGNQPAFKARLSKGRGKFTTLKMVFALRKIGIYVQNLHFYQLVLSKIIVFCWSTYSILYSYPFIKLGRMRQSFVE